MELGGSRLALATDELRALSTLGSLLRSGQKVFQDRALIEARRIVNGRDARYVLALYELEIGRQRGDDAMRSQALDVLIESKIGPRDRLPGYLGVRGQIAYRAGDLDTAERLWRRLADTTPDDAEVYANLAQVRLARKDPAGAIDLLSRAVGMRRTAGQPPLEGWYRQRLSIARQAGLGPAGIDAARTLVVAYPSAANWRIALTVYRQLAPLEQAQEIDLLRLMRHVGALEQPAEYQRMAQLLALDGEPGEAKAVLAEGVVRGLLYADASPTREIIAEVDRALAAPRRPTTATSVRPNAAAVALRSGVSQLLAGRRGDAEAAFRVIADAPANGRYADLAFFWLAAAAQHDRRETASV